MLFFFLFEETWLTKLIESLSTKTYAVGFFLKKIFFLNEGVEKLSPPNVLHTTSNNGRLCKRLLLDRCRKLLNQREILNVEEAGVHQEFWT